jgi:transposase
MDEYKETFGVDISKDVFDVHSSTTDHHQYKNEVVVSVVNPLIIKRFIQMKLAKIKTDKSDAKMICEFALINEIPLYTALTDVQSECLQLFRVLDNFIKHRTATKNKMHGEEVLGIPSKFTYRSLRRNKKHYDIEIKAIEEKILSLVKEDQQQQLTLLISVPGIGQKTALFLIIVTDGFLSFKQPHNFAAMSASPQRQESLGAV